MGDFLEEVYNASIPRETKADVVEYYQQKYPGLGRGGWKRHLVSDLLAWQDITPGSVGDVEYKRLSKNMDKRFEKRLNNLEPRNAEQYREFGKTLPPKAPEGGYHVYGVVWVKYSPNMMCEDRDVDEIITGDDAQALANLAAKEMLQALLNQYQTGDISSGGPDSCADPVLSVEAIE